MPEFLQLILKRIWLVTLTFMVALACAVVLVSREIPVYQCSATVEFMLPQSDENELQFNTRMQNTLGTLASATVLSSVLSSLDMNEGQLEPRIRRTESRWIAGTSQAELIVYSLDPNLGVTFVNQWADELIASRPHSEVAHCRIVEAATPGVSPITPRKLETIFVAAAGGLAVGFALAALLAWVDIRQKGPADDPWERQA